MVRRDQTAPWAPRWLDLERRDALGAFGTLAVVMAAHALLETARDALFLAELPAAELPWMYLAIAGLSLLVGPMRRACSRFNSRAVLSVMLAGSTLVTFGLWLGTAAPGQWLLYALYVWTGLYATLVVLQFWLVVSEAYTITQAKRVYAFIGAGAVLGALGGSVLARALAGITEARHLLLAASLFLVTGSLAPVLGLKRADIESAPQPAGPISGVLERFGIIGKDSYLRRVAALVIVATLALTTADYIFKSTVSRSISSERLAPFFANVNIGLGALSLVAQLGLLGWLLRRISVASVLAIVPAAVIIGSSGVALGGGLAAALVLIAAEGSLKHTLHGTGVELLFVPLSGDARYRARPVIEGVGRRASQGVASVLILLVAGTPNAQTWLATGLASLAFVWLLVTLDLKRHYLDLFRASLQRNAIKTRVDMPDLDLASLETLIAGLSSPEDRVVLASLNLLAAEGRAHLIPALILYHPSKKVVLRAFDILEQGNRTDLADIAERLLDHEDPEIRAAALRTRIRIRPDEPLLHRMLHDQSPAVRATALVGAVAHGSVSRKEASETLDSLIREGPTDARFAVVRAIRHRPSRAFEPLLHSLAAAPEPNVRAAAAEAMGQYPPAVFVPTLISMLSQRRVRPAVRQALVSIGAEALAALDEALRDESLPHEVRRHIPRTISRFRPSEAVKILLSRLLEERDGTVRFKILRGLGRLRADNPGLRLDPKILDEAVHRTLEAAFRIVAWRSVLHEGQQQIAARRTPGSELMLAMLDDRRHKTIERLFRLLGLRHRNEDYARIHRGLSSREAQTHASSLELLEHALSSPEREAVIGLVGYLEDRERLTRGTDFYEAKDKTYEETLTELLESSSESLACLAAYHVGELQLESLKPRLETLRDSASPDAAQVVDHALALYDTSGRESVLDVRSA